MLAVVDIGSNSVKYSVAELKRGALKNLKSRSWVTRLGQGLDKNHMLSESSLAATEVAFHEMAEDLAKLAPQCRRVVATAAVRECRNPERIAGLCEKLLGAPLEILSGKDEAEASMRGAAAAAKLALPDYRAPAFIDIGGASTEIGILQPEIQAHSFSAGARRCFEAFAFGEKAVSDRSWQAARKKISSFFPPAEWHPLRAVLKKNSKQMVAVGGTLVMAARLCAPQKDIHDGLGVLVGRDTLEAFNETLRHLCEEERKAIPGIFADRADIVCAGVLILTEIMNELGRDSVFITEWGLRHGLLLSLADH